MRGASSGVPTVLFSVAPEILEPRRAQRRVSRGVGDRDVPIGKVWSCFREIGNSTQISGISPQGRQNGWHQPGATGHVLASLRSLHSVLHVKAPIVAITHVAQRGPYLIQRML
jgi:hypothetical protein